VNPSPNVVITRSEATRNLLFPSDVNFIPGELGEHLFLISRWFYSNPREGEIFFHEKTWPYRRMMRACARLLAPPEQAGVDSSKTPKSNEGENRSS